MGQSLSIDPERSQNIWAYHYLILTSMNGRARRADSRSVRYVEFCFENNNQLHGRRRCPATVLDYHAKFKKGWKIGCDCGRRLT